MIESKSIYSKISKVMSQVNRVPKNGFNKFHKYAYATESDLTESIRPILIEARLAFFSTVLEQTREGEFTKVKMEFTLADLDTGETLKSTYWGEGQDKGDKGLYKAYTGATKYFLMKTFLIPTGDDPEGDTTVDERNENSQPVKLASEKQLNLITNLLKKNVSEKFSFEDLHLVLQQKLGVDKPMEQWTSEEASKAIKILQNK
jgi:ERF superfamily